MSHLLDLTLKLCQTKQDPSDPALRSMALELFYSRHTSGSHQHLTNWCLELKKWPRGVGTGLVTSPGPNFQTKLGWRLAEHHRQPEKACPSMGENLKRQSLPYAVYPTVWERKEGRVHVSLLVFFPPCPPTWWRHVTAQPADSLCACAEGGVAKCACAQSELRGFLEAERRVLVVDWRLGDGWRRPGNWRLKLRVVLAVRPSRESPSYQTAPLPSQERLLEENMSPDWSFVFFSTRRPSRPDGLDLRQRFLGRVCTWVFAHWANFLPIYVTTCQNIIRVLL